MVDPGYFAPFNAADAFAKGLKLRQMREDMAQQKAERQVMGDVFANGMPDRAKLGDLYRVNPEMGFKVQQYLGSLDDASRKRETAKWEAAAPLLTQAKQIPYEQRRAFILNAAPALMANGWTQEELASFDPTDDRISALSSVAMTVEQVIEANKLQWHQIGEQGSFATDQMGNPVGAGNPFAPQAQPQTSSSQQPGSVNDVFKALIQQESGGRPGVRGQQTAYGVPLGMTQMLPETAAAMAQKLGVKFSPDMLTGTSPEAAAMQEKLGRAYFDEGLQKYGGNVEKALMYYHGGPDERKWGPKTRTYAKAVQARLTKGGPRRVSSKAEYDSLPSGSQYIAPDGSLRTKS